MKKCLLLTLVAVLILLLPSCGTATDTTSADQEQPQDPSAPTLTFYEKVSMEEQEKIEAVIAEYLGVSSFELNFVGVGKPCNCDPSIETHSDALLIDGIAYDGDGAFRWWRYIELQGNIRNHIRTELIHVTENDELLYMPGMAKIVERYLEYGEDWRL